MTSLKGGLFSQAAAGGAMDVKQAAAPKSFGCFRFRASFGVKLSARG